MLVPRSRCSVSGHLIQAKIRHRNELTEKACEDAAQGLDKNRTTLCCKTLFRNVAGEILERIEDMYNNWLLRVSRVVGTIQIIYLIQNISQHPRASSFLVFCIYLLDWNLTPRNLDLVLL